MSPYNKDSSGCQQLVELQLKSQKDISNLNSMMQSLATQITALQFMVSKVTNEFKPNNQNVTSISASEQPSSTRHDSGKTSVTTS